MIWTRLDIASSSNIAGTKPQVGNAGGKASKTLVVQKIADLACVTRPLAAPMTSYAPHRSDLSTDHLLGRLLWGLSECTRLDLQMKPAMALPTIMTDN